MVEGKKYKDIGEALLHYAIIKCGYDMHMLDVSFCFNTLRKAFDRDYDNVDHLTYGIKDAMKSGIFEDNQCEEISKFYCEHIEAVISSDVLREQIEERKQETCPQWQHYDVGSHEWA